MARTDLLTTLLTIVMFSEVYQILSCIRIGRKLMNKEVQEMAIDKLCNDYEGYEQYKKVLKGSFTMLPYLIERLNYFAIVMATSLFHVFFKEWWVAAIFIVAFIVSEFFTYLNKRFVMDLATTVSKILH